MRAPIRRILLGVAVSALVVGGAAAQERDEDELDVDALILRADPSKDDWAAEALQNAAAAQLGSLGRAMTRAVLTADSLKGVAARKSRATPLRPKEMTRYRVAGGFEASRLPDRPPSEVSMTLSGALGEVVRPFDGRDGPAIEFKIVEVDAITDRSFVTTVRYEAAGHGGASVLQQTAYWSIEWSRQPEDRPPLISTVRLQSHEEVFRPTFVFSDRTRAVVPAGDWDTRLALGGEYWYGRTDSLGESNLMGHNGIAVGDVNGDGLEDVYLAMSTGLPNLLLVQNDDGTVTDTAYDAGVAWLDDTKGVLFADLDNDGDQDLLSAIGPTIVLAKNDGKGRFAKFVSMRAPTPAAFYSLSVADFDLDGDLDIYGTRYVVERYGISVPMPFHDANNGPTNHLLRNDGEDQFVDVTVSSGLSANNHRFSLIGAWADYDDDGDPDLYVANDFGRNNLYRNDGGTFVDVASDAGAEDQAAGMGVSWSDYDLDGDMDLYVTNMYSAAGRRVAYQPRFQAEEDESVRRQIQRHSHGNTLLANDGDGGFHDVSDLAGVRMGRWGWGSKFFDINNDGFDDIVVPNGFLTGAIEDDL